MELKFNEAKTVRPNHLERCLCYDKFLKGYRCYVYDDISKYWCTQATTEHDPNGDNHIVDYADYQVTKWASLQQEQQEVDLEKFTDKIKTFQERYKYPEIVSIKGAMEFMARMFYQYPNVARQWYDSLPKATMD